MGHKQFNRPAPAILGQRDIDAKVVGTMTLGDVSNGLNAIPCRLAFIAQMVAGLVTPPTVSVGTNDPDYDNIFPATSLATLTAPGKVKLEVLSDSFVCPPATEYKVNVSVAADATTFLLKIGLEVVEE